VTGAFLAGYDMNGNYLWAKTFLGSDSYSTGYGTAVAIDGSGNIALTGQILGGLSFDGNRLVASGNAAFFVTTFTSSGTASPVYRWGKSGGGGGESHGQGVAFDTLGHVVIGGYFYNTADFGGISATASAGVYNSFVTQYSK
jgi:hypothetical protein